MKYRGVKGTNVRLSSTIFINTSKTSLKTHSPLSSVFIPFKYKCSHDIYYMYSQKGPGERFEPSNTSVDLSGRVRRGPTSEKHYASKLSKRSNKSFHWKLAHWKSQKFQNISNIKKKIKIKLYISPCRLDLIIFSRLLWHLSKLCPSSFNFSSARFSSEMLF